MANFPRKTGPDWAETARFINAAREAEFSEDEAEIRSNRKRIAPEKAGAPDTAKDR